LLRERRVDGPREGHNASFPEKMHENEWEQNPWQELAQSQQWGSEISDQERKVLFGGQAALVEHVESCFDTNTLTLHHRGDLSFRLALEVKILRRLPPQV
jgi:hypothetical protein